MEQHPSEWVAALDTTIGAVASQIDRTRVQGIGVSGQQHGFVPLDAKGEVIRPAKLWCDTSTLEECEILTKKLGGEKAAIRKTGLAMLPGFTAPKILWLKRHEPKNYAKLRHVLLPHDYLNFYLTGEYFMEHGDASGTALMNVRTRKWSKPVIDAIDPKLANYLPPLSASDAIVGTLQPDLAAKYGFSEDVIVSAGGGDNMMGAIGTGNVKAGVVTASFGTSGTIYAHTLKPGHMARAAMEGVTMGMNYGLLRLAALGVKPKEIRVTGGGAKSPVWRQIMADVFGVPVVAMVEDEGAALGGAIQAVWAKARVKRPNARIATIADRIVAKDESTRVKPDKKRSGRYAQMQDVQDRVSTALRDVFPLQRALTNE